MLQCDSEEVWKTAFGMAAGTIEGQVTEEWYFCQSAGENESEFYVMLDSHKEVYLPMNDPWWSWVLCLLI